MSEKNPLSSANSRKVPADSERFALQLTLVGGIGGFLSWMLPVLHGQSPPGQTYCRALFWIVGSVVAGMTAAVVGVYLLARTDQRQRMHCVAVALVCGIAWQPVITAATRTYQKEAAQSETSAKSDSLQQEINVFKQVDSKLTPKDIENIAGKGVNLVHSLGMTDPSGDAVVRVKAERDILECLNALQKASADQPVAASEGLYQIGAEAARTRWDRITAEVRGLLKNIVHSAPDELKQDIQKKCENLYDKSTLTTEERAALMGRAIEAFVELSATYAKSADEIATKLYTVKNDRLSSDWKSFLDMHTKDGRLVSQNDAGEIVPMRKEDLDAAHAEFEKRRTELEANMNNWHYINDKYLQATTRMDAMVATTDHPSVDTPEFLKAAGALSDSAVIAPTP